MLENWSHEIKEEIARMLEEENLVEAMTATCEAIENQYGVNCTPRWSYSGRAMYGNTCVGLVTEKPLDAVALLGLTGAVMDSMGYDYIVYWPTISTPDTPHGFCEECDQQIDVRHPEWQLCSNCVEEVMEE